MKFAITSHASSTCNLTNATANRTLPRNFRNPRATRPGVNFSRGAAQTPALTVERHRIDQQRRSVQPKGVLRETRIVKYDAGGALITVPTRAYVLITLRYDVTATVSSTSKLPARKHRSLAPRRNQRGGRRRGRSYLPKRSSSSRRVPNWMEVEKSLRLRRWPAFAMETSRFGSL